MVSKFLFFERHRSLVLFEKTWIKIQRNILCKMMKFSLKKCSFFRQWPRTGKLWSTHQTSRCQTTRYSCTIFTVFITFPLGKNRKMCFTIRKFLLRPMENLVSRNKREYDQPVRECESWVHSFVSKEQGVILKTYCISYQRFKIHHKIKWVQRQIVASFDRLSVQN